MCSITRKQTCKKGLMRFFRYTANSGLLVFAFCYLTLTTTAFALTIQPHGARLEGLPKQQFSGVLSLTNETAKAMTLEARSYELGKLKNQFPGWFVFDPPEILLQPKETKKLNYTITIPEGAKGQLWTKLSFSEKLVPEKAAMIGIRTSISVYFIAVVKGTEVYSFTIQDIKFRSNDPHYLEIQVLNTGNVYIKPKGAYTIVDRITGEIVAQGVLNKNSKSVYPNGNPRKIVGQLDKPLPPGDYEVTTQLSCGDERYKTDKTQLLSTSEPTTPET